ncbi:MAG: tetratricopeptide repeat protein [Deltaproteobacteria bacterium]|nr:tetratricopeptide repeat protein [Deltaproteobacteria bacterium]MCW5809302.1 tetratricopeptide repeat protein [Deltaproteobacteria bacterium]
MGLRHALRLVAWTLGCIALPLALRDALGKPWGSIGVAIVATLTGWILLYLPRTAHAAFDATRFPLAYRRYRTLRALAFTRRRERAAHMSCVACRLAAGRVADAEAMLARVDPAQLDPAERVVWLNNRATAALDAGRDPADALALVEEATALRPDVPSVQHTRARALLAVGRTDDAITVLDAMRTGGELSPYLESERCRDLAAAWEKKGQDDYAADYRRRARLLVG